ncbi:hypothetical protein M569_02945 [Genlisea aurea]|uniref:Uncharacterized protein n=1 Tax=Genlisea aurea TaxID=192259 RepID=S8CWM1_9LAMI|nr:hypothetical protein M569_02945 [Genlisea aurea]
MTNRHHQAKEIPVYARFWEIGPFALIVASAAKQSSLSSCDSSSSPPCSPPRPFQGVGISTVIAPKREGKNPIPLQRNRDSEAFPLAANQPAAQPTTATRHHLVQQGNRIRTP